MIDMTPSRLYVLTALSRGPLHGLGISDQIAEVTDGRVLIGPANLYRALKELDSDGLIERVESLGGDAHRKYFGLTPLGREQLKDHLEVLRALVSTGQKGLRALDVQEAT